MKAKEDLYKRWSWKKIVTNVLDQNKNTMLKVSNFKTFQHSILVTAWKMSVIFSILNPIWIRWRFITQKLASLSKAISFLVFSVWKQQALGAWHQLPQSQCQKISSVSKLNDHFQWQRISGLLYTIRFPVLLNFYSATYNIL